MFYILYVQVSAQGNYALFGLRVREVSAIQGLLMYTSSSIRLSAIQGCLFGGVPLYYNEPVMTSIYKAS